MPEITVIDLGIFGLLLAFGLTLGWFMRARRCTREKAAVNAGWQAQMDSQQSEHDRLAGQNKSLMEQISQYQASNKDSNMRAKELSDSLKEAFERRDALQRQLKDTRSNLEVAVAQRDRLLHDAQHREARDEVADSERRDKDDKMQKLILELKSWQDRVPPLVERFRGRDQEAKQLEEELAEARERIDALESTLGSEHTRIEPVDSKTLPDGLDASNEPHIRTAEHDVAELQDQVANNADDEGELVDQQAADSHDPDDDDVVAVADTAWGEDSEEEPDDGADGQTDLAADAETNIARANVNWWEATDDDDDVDDEAAEKTVVQSREDVTADAADDVVAGDDQATADSSDDLQQIRGVGPAIEKTLNDLGIHRFNQIAEMSEYDIDRVAQHLRGFRSRIYREDWIGQARMLQHQKTSDHN